MLNKEKNTPKACYNDALLT